MKKVLIILLVLILTGCNEPIEVDVYQQTTQFKSEYEKYNGNGIDVSIDTSVDLKYLDTLEVIDLLENKTGVIYFGFPTCPWCRNIIPILFDVAKENNEIIYYFNPSSLRGTDDENFNKIMTILDSYLEADENGEKVLYVPDVYFIKNGNIVGHHLGSVISQINPFEPLTDVQKTELKQIYLELINKIKD